MLECSPCGKSFTGFESYEQHLKSEKHKKKMLNASKFQVNSSIDSDNDVESPDSKLDKAIKCQVCDLSFNSFESFQIHSASTEHALKVMMKQVRSNVIPCPSSDINNHELNATKCKVEGKDEDCILPELNHNESPNESYGSCKACSKIFSGPEPYKQHLESQAHIKKVASLQNTANFGGIGTLKCELCNKSFSGDVPYAQHMSSEVHKKKLQNVQLVEKYLSEINSTSEAGENKKNIEENKLWFCNICNKQCSGLVPYQQHIEGSIHFKNAKRVQNFVKVDSDLTSMMQVINNSEDKISEKPENTSRLVNGNYQKDNEKIYDDFVSREKINELKIIPPSELEKLIKVISPDEQINFDEADKSRDSANEKPDTFKQNKSQNNEEVMKIKISDENGFNYDLKKKTEEENKSEVYKICKICNVILHDDDDAIEHYESRQHFEKRWKQKV